MCFYYIVQTSKKIACLKALLQKEERHHYSISSTSNIFGFITNLSPFCKEKKTKISPAIFKNDLQLLQTNPFVPFEITIFAVNKKGFLYCGLCAIRGRRMVKQKDEESGYRLSWPEQRGCRYDPSVRRESLVRSFYPELLCLLV